MPERVIVCNTSPLLYLHQVSKLGLLENLYEEVTVPPAVESELSAGRERGVDVPVISDIPWIHVREPRERNASRIAVDLGAGEAEVIALGLELEQTLLVLDDQLARRIAELNGLPFTGTLGILVRAKQAGVLDAVRPTLMRLQETTMWLPEKLVRAVLVEAQEAEEIP